MYNFNNSINKLKPSTKNKKNSKIGKQDDNSPFYEYNKKPKPKEIRVFKDELIKEIKLKYDFMRLPDKRTKLKEEYKLTDDELRRIFKSDITYTQEDIINYIKILEASD